MDRIYVDQQIDKTEIDARMANYDEEKRLLTAILTDALDCIVRRSRDWRKDFAWFNSEDTNPVHSFLWICSSLGLEPECIRDLAIQVRDNPERFIGRFKGKGKYHDHPANCLGREEVEDEE